MALAAPDLSRVPVRMAAAAAADRDWFPCGEMAEAEMAVRTLFDALDGHRREWIDQDVFVDWAVARSFGPAREAWPDVLDYCLDGIRVLGGGRLTHHEVTVVVAKLASPVLWKGWT
eukprot:EG_transcript_25951